jgi:hypothetical protein
VLLYTVFRASLFRNWRFTVSPYRLLRLAAALSFCVPALATTVTINETIGSHEGPWLYVNGGLNTSDQYGVDDQTAPTVVSAANGFDFSAGSVFTLLYISGTTAAGPSFASVDANGNHSFPFNNNPGSSGKVAPSAYMNPATYPIYLSELVGTFANSSGAIIGTPFSVGDGPTMLTVPSGATQLQLGINDDIYSDNSGSLVVRISGPGSVSGVPEPSTVGFICVAVGLGALIRRRKLV